MPKSKNPAKNAPKRDAQGKFVKGSVHNPTGRPKMGESLTDILREYGNKKWKVDGKNLALKEHLAQTVYRAVVSGYRVTNGEKTTLNDVTWAKLLEWLYDRVDGKPTEKLQIGSPDVEVTSEDIDAAMNELAEWKKHRASKIKHS